MGGSSGGSGDTTVTSRYAPYIETKHTAFLENSETYGDLIRNESPYTTYEDFDFADGLYGSGYTMASFPSLFDMYGKFMGGLDVEALFSQVLAEVYDMDTIRGLSDAHRDLLDDDIEQTALPRFYTGMRDMNSVMASSFATGGSIIEQARLKKVAEFDAELRYKLIPVAAEVFAKHLAWNQSVVSTYAEVMKFAMVTEMDTVKVNLEFAKLDKIWPFYVMEYERANIGALQGAVTRNTSEQGPESSTLGGVMGGAAMGASLGSAIPGVGTLFGAAIGGIAGAFM
jgi:hypothetical protein